MREQRRATTMEWIRRGQFADLELRDVLVAVAGRNPTSSICYFLSTGDRL